VRPLPSLYRGVGTNPSPSPKPRLAAKEGRVGGQVFPPPSRSSPRVSPRFGRLGPMGPCAPGPMRPGHSLIGPCPLPEGGATLVPFRKVLEASGTIPINPEQFRTPKTALPYMNLILRTIPEPLVISRIPSETPNKNS